MRNLATAAFVQKELIRTIFYHLGRIPTNISKLIPGIGCDKVEIYSSLKRLLTMPLREREAQEKLNCFSSSMLFIKYGGSLPVRDMSLLDMVYRSE